MTKSIALEVASRRITVNCIAPGFIKTAMTSEILEKMKIKLLIISLLKELGCLMIYLVWLNSYMIKLLYYWQTFHVNGGMLM